MSYKIRRGPAGVHFFSRSSGSNILLDGVVPKSNLWSRAPRNVSIALTNICDLKCDYCYAPKNSYSLDFSRLSAWIEELDREGCFGVGFGGGEPTLYPRFTEICNFVAKETQLAVTFTTHGHGLTDEMIKEIEGKVNFVRVSMDGVGETYSRHRGRPFQTFLERVVALRKIVSVGINVVVNEKTLSELDEIVSLADSLKISEILLLPEKPSSRSGGVSSQVLFNLKDWISEYRGPVALAISEGSVDADFICEPLRLEGDLGAFAHISADGLLRRTSFSEKGVPIGYNGVILALEKLSELESEEIP